MRSLVNHSSSPEAGVVAALLDSGRTAGAAAEDELEEPDMEEEARIWT